VREGVTDLEAVKEGVLEREQVFEEEEDDLDALEQELRASEVRKERESRSLPEASCQENLSNLLLRRSSSCVTLLDAVSLMEYPTPGGGGGLREG